MSFDPTVIREGDIVRIKGTSEPGIFTGASQERDSKLDPGTILVYLEVRFPYGTRDVNFHYLEKCPPA